MIEEIIRRKKHNGFTRVGDKIIRGRRSYQYNQYNIPKEYTEQYFTLYDIYGKKKQISTSKYFNSTINICGYSYTSRMKNLGKLFREGKLLIGKLPNSLIKKILSVQ